MINYLNKNKYYLVIFVVVFLIFITNYQPGTYLSGWDNLQTDLYPWLAVKRAFFAVWQEYQSFGLLGGMAHSSDLVRAVFLWLTSFIIPQNFVRYFFHCFMLLLGGFGMFKLLMSLGLLGSSALLGSLFYLLNLGTIQIFAVPFESFSTFFGLLPWEVWIFITQIQSLKLKKKNLLIFFIINLLATPQGYVQTIFIVYLFILGCLTLGLVIEQKSAVILKRGFFLLLLIIVANSFWLLPQIYFLRTSSYIIPQAKSTQLSNEGVIGYNEEKGNLQSFIKMEGFYFNLLDKNSQYLFAPWKLHRENTVVLLIITIVWLTIVIGFFKRTKYRKSFMLLFLLVAIALLNAVPPFSWFNDLVKKNHFINQIFRSPFTKFIIPYSLVVSYFFSSGIDFITHKINKKTFRLIYYLIIFSLIIFYSLPSFQGFFFAPEMKVKIPDQYFQVFNYFKTIDKNKRIALLPDYTFWGWFFHQWGYNGSGFLWYGIEQPIISRTFDVWSEKSEGYFWEIKTAIESEDINKFNNLLEKYDVDYLLIDYSLMPITTSAKGLQYDRLKKILNQDTKIKIINEWNSIAIYQIKHNEEVDNFIKVSENMPNIGPVIKLTNDDTAYHNYGDYLSDPMQSYDIYFPFLDLTTQTNLFEKKWSITDDKNNFILKRPLEINLENYNLSVPNNPVTVSLFDGNNIVNYPLYITTSFDQGTLNVTINKQIIKNFNLYDTNVINCRSPEGQIYPSFSGKSIIIISEKKANGCFNFNDKGLEQKNGYLLTIEAKNIEGRSLLLYIVDDTKKQNDVEDRLINGKSYYIINPKNQSGLGYNFNFNNDSFENQRSINKVDSIKLYLFPFQEIKNISFINKHRVITKAKFIDTYQSEKNNYFTYQTTIPINNNQKTLILYQSFHQGWRAYRIYNSKFRVQNLLNTYLPFIFGKEIKEHVLVNNWANGWKLNSEFRTQNSELQKIVIIFLPQYLEYFGFFLLIPCFIFLLKYKNDRQPN